MKVSKNSKYHTHKKTFETLSKNPKRPNWRARCPLAQASGGLKGALFRIFKHPLLQNIKKLKAAPFVEKFFEKKSHNAEKTEREDPLVSPVLYVTRKKRKNIFGPVR